MSESLLRISLTTSSVIISNCLPIALENDSGIVLINSYTSYAKIWKMECRENRDKNQTIYSFLNLGQSSRVGIADKSKGA